MKPIPRTLLLALLAFGLAACGGQNSREVALQAEGNTLHFAQIEFAVKAGQPVRLVFENKATAEGLSHNVVILADKASIDRVGLAAAQAAENDYIPEDNDVLFYTPLAAPGETVEVTFTAPSEPGEYPYLCTFPGHYVTMRGVMKVT